MKKYLPAIISGFIMCILPFLFATCNQITITHYNEVHILEKPSQIDTSEYMRLTDSFNLTGIEIAGQQLGSLYPKYPIAVGKKSGFGSPSLYSFGCLNPTAYSLIVKVDSTFRLANTLNDLKEIYAPIETKEEALSYVLTYTGREAQYEFTLENNYRTFVNTINTTSVAKKNDAYEVNLFDYQLCGCGPHSYLMFIYTINKNGDIIEKDFKKLYENPIEDGLCVD